MDKMASKTTASKFLLKTFVLLPPTCNGINIDHTQKTQRSKSLTSDPLAQVRELLPRQGISRSSEDPLAQARILQPRQVQNVTFLAQASQLSLRRDHSRSSELTLAQARILQYSPGFHPPSPYIISRVFKMKFEELLHDLKKIHVLGKVLAYIYIIEFQKRGLPHAHLLIFCIRLMLSDEELQNLTLVEIEKQLQRNRRSLRDYPTMPYPKGYITRQLGNRLIYDELNYDTNELKDNFNLLFQSLTDEQCGIFKTIMEVVNQEHGRMFFLYGYGRTGKTHMWRTLTYALRSQKQIVLTEGEQHTKFKIYVPSLENSICNIHQGSELVGLLKQTKLIIYDEALMSQNFCFEALDKCKNLIFVIQKFFLKPYS
ncbi:hypothetical protein Lal_00042734 [Lupinus albus]|nr:hypothetical protein Lal_00042734 [Lupinus albus]